MHSALTLPRFVLLLVLGGAGLVWTVAGTREAARSPAVARIDSPFSLWGPLRQLGCAAPNEHGTFIAAKLLPDENGDPYIFGCTEDGLTINGRSVR